MVRSRNSQQSAGYTEAVAEEARSHDDIVTPSELEIAPVFTPEELDFAEYRWGRGDARSERDIAMYEAGVSRLFRGI